LSRPYRAFPAGSGRYLAVALLFILLLAASGSGGCSCRQPEELPGGTDPDADPASSDSQTDPAPPLLAEMWTALVSDTPLASGATSLTDRLTFSLDESGRFDALRATLYVVETGNTATVYISRATVWRSLYSDMSSWMTASSVPNRADGLQYHHQGYGYNNALAALVEHVMVPGPRVPGSVNLFGEVIGGSGAMAREKFILRDLLAEAGILVNLHFPGDCAVADIARAPRACLNIPRCAPMADRAAQLMEDRFGVPYLKVPMPYGLRNTDRWLRETAARVGQERAAERVIRAGHARLEPLLAAARRRLSGRVAAVHGGPGRVVANIAVAHELGLRVGMVSMFFSTPLACRQVIDALAEIGEDPQIFLDCSLEEVRRATRELGVEVWFGNSLDFPQTYEETGMPAFETLIYQVPYQGYEGYANALRHFIHRDRLSSAALERPAGQAGCRRRPGSCPEAAAVTLGGCCNGDDRR